MTQVMIVFGTYGHKPEGAKRITPISIGETVELPDAEAARLVGLGIAQYVHTPLSQPSAPVATPNSTRNIPDECDTQGDENDGAEDEETAHLDREQLESMTNADLKTLAKDMGIATGSLKTKNALIEAIVAVEVAPGLEDDEELPPDLGAEAPVV